MCFGTVHLLLDKASENDLSIKVNLALSMVDEGKSRIYVRAEAKNERHMREREGGSPLGMCSPCRLSAQVLQLC